MPNSKTLVQAILVAFCAILCGLSALGGGGMMIGARTAAWAKAGGPTPPTYGWLCFTAETANSSVQLTAVGSAPTVTLVKSFDGVVWSDYSVGDTIELQSVGDFVYFAAGEGGNETFGASTVSYHKFVIAGRVGASGDITSLRRFDMENTTLASYCYFSMFHDCTGLTSAPELPATALATYCYGRMFYGCNSLTSAPELPATALKSNCYQFMFCNCYNLSSMKVGFSEWPISSYTGRWVQSVSEIGTFYKPSALSERYGFNNIPTGWTVVNID